jgi:hypothetical protein
MMIVHDAVLDLDSALLAGFSLDVLACSMLRDVVIILANQHCD